MLELLKKLENDGYVRTVKHNTLPLVVYNYTPKTQFESAWGEYPILRKCRGLVLDIEGKIWATPFPKFHNWEELQPSELPCNGDKIEITEKMDGSLIIVFRYNDQVVYSTRGSFYSDQCLAAQKLFKEMYSEDWVEDSKTYLFEYIGNTNQIVVRYDKHDLVHLALLDTSSGFDLSRDSRFNLVPTYELHGGIMGDELYQKLKSLDMPNKEGFVIRQVSDGTFPDWRGKIKYENYIFLHKVVTGISNRSVHEYLRDGKSFDEILEICPDEFNEWLKKTKQSLENEYNSIHELAKLAYENVVNLPTRKDQAMEILSKYKDISAIVFSMLDNSDYSRIIWDKIKPDKFVQPFSSKEEA